MSRSVCSIAVLALATVTVCAQSGGAAPSASDAADFARLHTHVETLVHDVDRDRQERNAKRDEGPYDFGPEQPHVESAGPSVGAKNDDRPWRLQHVLEDAGAPEWLRMSGSVRVRYEGLDGQFRSAGRLDDEDHVFVMRTLFKLGADFEDFGIYAELEDSRHYGGDSGSSLSTATVNTVELLQAHVLFRFGDEDSGRHQITAGRQTFNLGSRRLVARNRYRNTINAFNGVHWEWKKNDAKVTGFYTLPILRRPFSRQSLNDRDIAFDEEDFDHQFFGLHYQDSAFERHVFDIYAFGMLEDVGRDRDIFTFGGRLLLPKKTGLFDYQIEAAVQVGKSRLSGAGRRLDHFAGFTHLSVGYTFDCDWSPRIRIALDYASGDDDPNDGDNNRFDTLFGARRFEYGPTGFYGAIGRFNLLSPELRVEVKPRSDMTLFVAWRVFMLADPNDAWVAARVQDPTGDSGRLVGNQIEARWRYEIVPQVVRLEAGVAHMIGGEFQSDAPGGQDNDTIYGYVQLAFTF